MAKQKKTDDSTEKKTTAKKTAPNKKAATKSSTVKKTATKKTTPPKAAAKATPEKTAKKTAAKKATAATKKTAAKKATAPKAVSKTATGKKSAAMKAGGGVRKTVSRNESPSTPVPTVEEQAMFGFGKKKKKAETVEEKTPTKTTPQKAVAKKTTPSKAASKKTVAKKTVSKKTVPPKGTSSKATVKKTSVAKTTTVKTTVAASVETEVTANISPSGLGFENLDIHTGASDNVVVQAGIRHFELEQTPRTHGVIDYERSDRELPEGYGETTLVLVARDPEWAFAYWEASPHDMARAGVSHSELSLRIYDVTDVDFDGSNAHSQFDIIVGAAKNWYFRVPVADRMWVADLGMVGPDGAFRTVARSNPISTPRDTISPFVAGENGYGEGGDGEAWMTVEKGFERIFELSGGRFQKAIGNSESAAGLGRVTMPRIEMGSEALASGALFGGGELEDNGRTGRVFRLVVNTELIVYGATEPGAIVTIQGHPVRVGPDGTFRLRLALPDGVQDIPVRAESPDGLEARTITPIITRETK